MTATAGGRARRRADASATVAGWASASRSACWRSSSPCRRCTVRSIVPVVAARACSADGRGDLAVGGGERRLGWCGDGRRRSAGSPAASPPTQSGAAHLEQVVVWGALLASTLRYATPLIFARARRAVLRAQRRHQHRARGDDADRRVLRRLGRGHHGLVGRRARDRPAGGRRCSRCIHAVFAVSLRADQIVSGTALNLLALGITGYLYVDIYGNQGTPDDLPAVPDVQAADQVRPAARRRVRPAQPARLAGAGARCSSPGSWSSARHAASACARPARTRWPPRRRACRSCARATLAVDDIGRAGRAGRRVPVDRLRPLVLPEHDRGARVHRAGRR